MVSFFFIPPFLTVGQFLGVTPNQWKRPIRFPDEKFYAESFEQLNYYSRSMLDPENWWCVLVQFEIFGLLNQKKDLKIPYVWHFICLLIINFKKKMHACKAAAGGPLGNFIYRPTIVCSDTPVS